MKKKIVSILIGMLMIAIIPAITGATTDNITADVSSNTGNSHHGQNNAIWDLQFSFDLFVASGANGNTGAMFDGTYFYSTRWASNLMHKYDITGALVEQFSIPSVSGVRTLAYDGQYFYGGANAYTLYQMDFAAHTLIGSIATPEAVRACTYDSTNDGFWISNWATEIYLIDRTGSIMQTISNPGLTSMYGMAYDPVSAGGPYLWIFDQVDGTQQVIYQLEIASGSLTGVEHDVSSEFSNAGIAGGLFTTADLVPGKYTLGGTSQGVNDILFCYEIADISSDNTPPVTTCECTGTNPVTVTLTATDETGGSGVDYTMYKLDSGTYTTYTAPVVVTAIGDHIVYYYSVDKAGNIEAEKNCSFTVQAPPPAVTITIKGGFGVSATIKNTGTTNLTNLDWEIALDGKLIFVGKSKSDTIASLAAGAEVKVKDFVIGFGKTNINVTVGTAEESASGTAFLFFVFGVK